MAVDIRYIAKMAGVSPATVSRVLNGTKPVSPALRKKVTDAVQKYNYYPNSMARGLILKRSNLLGVMVPNVSNAFHAQLISAIEQTANPLGYNVIISNVHKDFAQQKRNFTSLCEQQVDGILLLHENTPEELAELRSIAPIPMILASINVPNCELTTVAIDEAQAAFQAVDYLIRLGHRRIAGIFNDCYSLGVLRRQGYERALQAANIPLEAALLSYGECSMEAGAQQCQKLFALPHPPTALFCVSDEIAIGAIYELKEQEIRVPDQVSVVGFDDIGLGQIIRPKLTTVHQPIQEIGSHAALTLIQQIEQEDFKPIRITLPCHLEIRDSCAPCSP